LKRLAIALAAASFALVACEGDHAPSRDLPGMPSPAELVSAAMSSGVTITGAPETSSSSTTAGSTASETGLSMDALAGTWEGAYDAKKGRLSMPTGVRDEARAADDGKIVVGPGLVRITISSDGTVSGKSQGVLGMASVRGKIDGKMLRASFIPDDLTAPHAMTGVLIGPIKDGVIQAELRVAGPDAILVRQANFEIKKKQ